MLPSAGFGVLIFWSAASRDPLHAMLPILLYTAGRFAPVVISLLSEARTRVPAEKCVMPVAAAVTMAGIAEFVVLGLLGVEALQWSAV